MNEDKANLDILLQAEIRARLEEKIRELEESERRARASADAVQEIIEACPDPISITRYSDGTYLESNPQFETSGYTAKEVSGKSSFRVGLWAEKADYKRYIAKLNEQGFVRNMEVSFKNKNGRIMPCLLSSAIVELNGERCIVSFTRDISRIKEAENKLRESEATLRKIIDTSPDAITINRLSDGEYTAVNHAFTEAVGYRAEELIGKSPRELGIWADLRQTRVFMKRLRDASMVRSLEVALKHKNGQVLPHLLSSVTTEIGGEQCIVTISRDITEIKNFELELTAAREAALAADRAKSEFLSSMSHEIRTPMNAVLGMAELLAESPLGDEQRHWIDVMRSNGEALLELINDILDLAKIESGGLHLEQTDFDLYELIDKVGDLIGVRVHGKGLELALRIAPDVPRNLIGDPLRLRQILVNLLGNADKFTERGEIVLNVERATPAGEGESVKLRFSVRDTGIGIASDKLDVIFSTFGQADTSTTRRYGGSGLGLAIVRKLVVLYGGEITVESEPGIGSCFTFVANFGVGRALETIKPARVDLRGLEVLVVDDTAVNRLILREILERRSATVTEAESGAAALSEVARRARRPFDLMLLDCRMPSMDGFELARRVRQFCIGNGTPPPTVIMLTSDEITLGTARLREAGLNAYLVKPVRRDELLDAIQLAMGEAKVSTRHRPADSDVAGALANLKILLADDSPDNRLLVRAFLSKTGCELVEAEDGSIAFDRFRAARYDLVLMDMRMPVMDGFVATRAIRQWEAENGARHTPIVALTASALNEAVRECLEAGCDAHVSKPVKRATLIDAIRRELRGGVGDSEAEAPGAS